MATVKDISELAGVSRGTVDRVLNNRGIVKSETAERVKKIAETLDYKPNKVAKALTIRRRDFKFGFIMLTGNSTNQFFSEVETGIKYKIAEFKEYGIFVDIKYVNIDDSDQQILIMEQMRAGRVNGVAMMPINTPAIVDKINELVSDGIPVVTVNTDVENSNRLAYVGSNYQQSGKTAAALMNIITGGSANVGVIVGSLKVMCHAQRVDSFCNYVSSNYPDIHITDVIENFDDDIESFAVTQELLTSHPNVNALYIASAGIYGACRAVQVRGLSGKIKIISFDCIPTTSQLIKEGVIAATIDQQPFVQGSLPLDILFEYLVNNAPPASEKNYTNIVIKIKENLYP